MKNPTAADAERALVEASKLTSDPIRARLVAVAALIRSFPGKTAHELAALANYPAPKAAGAAVRKARDTKNWWNEDWVDEVVGALVADRYGERSA